jgi:hypothetical protein
MTTFATSTSRLARFSGACLLVAGLFAGCHIASGLSELEVVDGGEGGGGSAAVTVESMCEFLCEVDEDRMCNGSACDPQDCERFLFADSSPWCEELLTTLGACYQDLGFDAFNCDQDEGHVTPADNTCRDENIDYALCINEGQNPNIVADCNEGCLALQAQGCVASDACVAQCEFVTTAGNQCSGAWSGLAHCVAKYPTAPWTCGGGDFTTVYPATPDHPCWSPIVALSRCDQSDATP